MTVVSCLCGFHLSSATTPDADKSYCIDDERVESAGAKVMASTQTGVDAESAFYLALELDFDVLLRCRNCARLLRLRQGRLIASYRQE